MGDPTYLARDIHTPTSYYDYLIDGKWCQLLFSLHLVGRCAKEEKRIKRKLVDGLKIDGLIGSLFVVPFTYVHDNGNLTFQSVVGSTSSIPS